LRRRHSFRRPPDGRGRRPSPLVHGERAAAPAVAVLHRRRHAPTTARAGRRGPVWRAGRTARRRPGSTARSAPARARRIPR